MIHLDTSYLVDLLRETTRDDPGPATRKPDVLAEEQLTVSVHVACELHAGAELSKDPEQEKTRMDALLHPLGVVFPDERFPASYGSLLAELGRRGESISTMDLLIATTAVVDGAAILTRNVWEFERVPGLYVLSYCVDRDRVGKRPPTGEGAHR